MAERRRVVYQNPLTKVNGGEKGVRGTFRGRFKVTNCDLHLRRQNGAS